MRSFRSKSHFFDNMKKKPALQKILDNLENYSEEEINKLSQPKWIREELKVRLERKIRNVLTPIEIAKIMTEKSELKQEFVDVYEYYGEDFSVLGLYDIRKNDLIACENEKLLIFGKKLDKRLVHNIRIYRRHVLYKEFVTLKNDRIWKTEFPNEDRTSEF